MKRARALSLIEVVLALVILGLAVPPVVLSVTAGVKQQQTAMIEQNLVQLASERLGEIRAAMVDPRRGYAAVTTTTFPDEAAPRGMVGYGRRVEIREVSPTNYLALQPNSGIKRIRITATGPQSLSLAVESFVTNVLDD